MFSVCPPGGLFATRSEVLGRNCQAGGWPLTERLSCLKLNLSL